MKTMLLLLAGLAVAMGACPNACSGHGTCGLSSKCTCQARWVGNDCSQRECPSGLSWIVGSSNTNVPAGGDLGGYHAYAECSDRGTCDRDSGECQCVEGYEGRGCRRTSCPNACSGHGFCRYGYEVNSKYAGFGSGSSGRRYDTQQWDAAKTRQCVCDRGYEGIDCASRICPKGDDPLTSCLDGTTPGNSVNDIQTIEFKSGGSYGATKYFSITFKDMFNGVYTTRPIDTDFGTTNAHYKTWSAGVKAALEELPNFAIPKVDVATEKCAGTASSRAAADGGPVCTTSHATNSHVAAITFVDAANSGKQNAITVSDENVSHDSAKMQPRFVVGGAPVAAVTAVAEDCTGGATCDAVTLGTLTAATDCEGTSGCTYTAEVVGAPASGSMVVGRQDPTGANKLEEHLECSNRGTCDGDTGLCQCFEGFTGEACHEQTVFF